MRALISGVSGQDGAYLAKLLLDKGYHVIGTSRDSGGNSFSGLAALGIVQDVEKISMAPNDYSSVFNTLKKYHPDEIYNLSGQSSVGLSFEQPLETINSIAVATLNFLEAIRHLGVSTKFYNAGSGECYGDTGEIAVNEGHAFRPRSPYGVAKASAHGLVSNYRESFSLFACTGILFNHESPLRPQRFVTSKIIHAAKKISQGEDLKLVLGNIEVARDWGWAPDYVRCMWLMLQQQSPRDFIIATGRTEPLRYFIEKAFAYFSLNWKDYVVIDESLFRPSDISINRADPALARSELDWRPMMDIDGVVKYLCLAAEKESKK